MNETSAFIAIDKPAGISSFQVIRQLRKITGIRKIGHCGTLDPFATGLLICCIGSYTRLASFVEAEDKCYSATIKLGEKSSTGDTEGEIVEVKSVPATFEPTDIEKHALALDSLPVPAFSAVKIEGERAYSLARKGIEVIIPKRATRISSFRFIPWEDGTLINSQHLLGYRCVVSKGTYIRSLSEWLAEQIGTVGHTIQLVREGIGNLSLNVAVKLDDLETESWHKCRIDPRVVLAGLSWIMLSEDQYKLVINGGDVRFADAKEGVTYALQYDGVLVAVGASTEGIIHPRIVLK